MGLLGSIASLGLKDLVFGVLDRIKLPPERKAEIRLLMHKHDVDLAQLEVEYETKIVESVNATMRAEAASGSWMQRSWRPMVGFTFCGVLINNYILLPYFARAGFQPIVIPGEVWSAMLVVLGVAAGTRGMEKWQRAKGK